MYKAYTTITCSMGKFGLLSDKSSIPFDSHLDGLEESNKELIVVFEKICKVLG